MLQSHRCSDCRPYKHLTRCWCLLSIRATSNLRKKWGIPQHKYYSSTQDYEIACNGRDSFECLPNVLVRGTAASTRAVQAALRAHASTAPSSDVTWRVMLMAVRGFCAACSTPSTVPLIICSYCRSRSEPAYQGQELHHDCQFHGQNEQQVPMEMPQQCVSLP